MKTMILSVGGSIVAPEFPDCDFLKSFVSTVKDFLAKNPENRLILVIGGGGPARIYQKAFREVTGTAAGSGADAADWIGIMATRLNAQLVKASFGELCAEPVVTDPTAATEFTGRILVAAGWKPGFSTDNDAVLLAEKFGGSTVVNLSNIEKVYTDDPRKNPDAKPLDTISWADFCKMVGDEWVPGKNCPFDPIASKKASSLGLKVICAGGKNLSNIRAILEGQAYIGTTIG
ncbi:MAG: UMP kinase [Treponema sp.]|nr:UMP kinase [Treponema sp.]